MIGTIISIVVLYFTYAYLKGLKTCDCANDLYVTRLKNLEAILLGLNVVLFCFAILSSFRLFNALDIIKRHILKIAMLGGITMLIFHILFVYNGYEFWNTLKDNCTCADGWEKYYIYFQTIIYFVIVLLTTVLSGVLAFRKIHIGSSDETMLNEYIEEPKQRSSSSKKRSSRSKSSKRK